ncbi:hypothetical protein ACFU6R_25480 [Streptomyces sp. NPDC057499]|uniref:hypothetical protein n=1 Tax=Streptomyces sp. NPDC057499 TaxID=3346150 RepID=UPI0036939776
MKTTVSYFDTEARMEVISAACELVDALNGLDIVELDDMAILEQCPDVGCRYHRGPALRLGNYPADVIREVTAKLVKLKNSNTGE